MIIEIRARIWFDKTYGNSYHTYKAYVNDELKINMRDMAYGHQEIAYNEALRELEKQGHIPPRIEYENGYREFEPEWKQRNNIIVFESFENVKKKDL